MHSLRHGNFVVCGRFITRTCNGCAEFEVTGKDIPSEAFMHFVYLGKFDIKVTLSKLYLFKILYL